MEANNCSSSRRDCATTPSNCTVSTALDSCRPSSSARLSNAMSSPGSTRTPSNTTVPSARRHPRNGTVRTLVASVRVDARPARCVRSAAAAGAIGSSARTASTRDGFAAWEEASGIERARLAIVQPDRGAVGREEASGDDAEWLERLRQVQRGCQLLGECRRADPGFPARIPPAVGASRARAQGGNRRGTSLRSRPAVPRCAPDGRPIASRPTRRVSLTSGTRMALSVRSRACS